MKYAVPELPGSCKSLEGLLEFIGDKDGRQKWWKQFQKEYKAAKELSQVTMSVGEAETARLQAVADRTRAAQELEDGRKQLAAERAEMEQSLATAREALFHERRAWDDEVAQVEKRNRELEASLLTDKARLEELTALAEADAAAAAADRAEAEALKAEWEARKAEADRVFG